MQPSGGLGRRLWWPQVVAPTAGRESFGLDGSLVLRRKPGLVLYAAVVTEAIFDHDRLVLSIAWSIDCVAASFRIAMETNRGPVRLRDQWLGLCNHPAGHREGYGKLKLNDRNRFLDARTGGVVDVT